MHGNVCLHIENTVTELLYKYGQELLVQMSHSPDMIPPDLDLSLMLKEPMCGYFSTLEELSAAVTQAMEELNKTLLWNSKTSDASEQGQ